MKLRFPAVLEAALLILLAATVAWRIAVDRGSAENDHLRTPTESAQTLLQQADEAFQQYKLAGAAALYNDALKQDPANLKARIQLARLFHINNWNESAVQMLEETLERDPENLKARMLYAKIHRDEGRSKEAAQLYEEALQTNPNNAEALYYLGTAYQADGMIGEAVRSYQKAVESDPNLERPELEETPFGAQARLQIGRAYRQMERLHRRRAQEAARNGDGEEAKRQTELGDQWGDAAIRQLESAHEAAVAGNLEQYGDPLRELTSALAQKALKMRRNGEPETEVLRVFQRIVQFDPNDIDAWIQAGDILRLNKDYEEALRHYEAAHRIDPKDMDAHTGMLKMREAVDQPSAEESGGDD